MDHFRKSLHLKVEKGIKEGEELIFLDFSHVCTLCFSTLIFISMFYQVLNNHLRTHPSS